VVKIKNATVEEILKSEEGNFEVTEETFEFVMNNMERKNKRSYNFIVKTGNKYKRVVFKMCKRILEKEEIPLRFFLTLLIQLYKGKGSCQDLSNSRFIHIKDWLPRLCESLVVCEMKDDIIDNTSKFQCGGMPGMRPQFHLFVVKSIMAKSVKDQGNIFTLTDFQKFFDKEMLNDVILSLHGDVDKKALRVWWKLNSRTRVTVRTGLGNTEEGEAGACLGQGSKGGGLGSMRTLDKCVSDYFEGSEDEDSYGGVRLQPQIWVDDLLRSSPGVQEVRCGNVKLSEMVKEMCLEIHLYKSCYLVVGSDNFKEKVEAETAEDPIMFGKFKMKKEIVATYLGDEIHSEGLEASIEASIQARQGKVRGAMFQLVALWGDYRAQVVGGVLGAITLFDACIVTSLLNNASTWIGINDHHYKLLDSFLYDFLRALLQLPGSTPLACLRGATAVMGMKWRVWQEKLLLVLAIRRLEGEVLAKEVFQEQVVLGLPGLAKEASHICSTVGLPDISICCLKIIDKEEIKEKIFYHHYKCVKEELRNLKVKGTELIKKDLRRPQEYFLTSSLPEARMSFRLQNRMLDIPSDMRGRYLGRMGCEACLAWRRGEGGEEKEAAPTVTASHLEVCPGYAALRAGKDLYIEKDKVLYFIQVMRMRSMRT
jgi:hypothetical protein